MFNESIRLERAAAALLGLCLTVLVVGCLPEKRVHWSPDGRWAAVLGSDGLYLCDEKGELTDRLLAGGRRVTWQRDGRMFCAVSAMRVSDWKEAARLLTAAQQEQIRTEAEALRTRLLAGTGTLEERLKEAVGGHTGGTVAAALLLLRSGPDEELAERFGEEWKPVEEFQLDAFDLVRIDVGGAGVRGTRHLLRTFDEPVELRLAPDGQWLAWVTNRPGGPAGATRLVAMPVEPEVEPTVVMDDVAHAFDWTIDGRALVFAATQGWFSEEKEEELRLGVLARRALRDDEGHFLETLPEAEDLAGILFHREARVRVLPDQRIVFAVRAANLPAPARDLPPRLGLFVYDAQAANPVRAIVPDAAALGPQFREALSFFEPSPDGRYAAVCAGDQAIGVLALDSGAWWSLEKYSTAAGEPRSQPSWRGRSELCFVSAPPGGTGRATVVLAQLDFENRTQQRRIISAEWPAAVVRGFLTPDEDGPDADEAAPKPESAPATRPAAAPPAGLGG